jgi:hypothetical protein
MRLIASGWEPQEAPDQFQDFRRRLDHRRMASVVTVKVVPTVGGLSMRTIRSIRSDLISASAVATSPPMEWPMTVIRSTPSLSKIADTNAACRSIE